VLGGGGSTGNAWLIGVAAGLLEGGVDVTTADLTIGTSAGATAAAQLAASEAGDLYAATVATASSPPAPTAGPRPAGPEASSGRPNGLADHLDRLRETIAASSDLADYRRRMGAIALAGDTTEVSERWRATVAARLSTHTWPDRTLFLTAVDAQTGDPVVFDRSSGVDLVDAVAASTAGGGFAYRIGERWYIDGGYRANAENADLAAGYDRVLVLSPLSGASLLPESWGTHLSAQVQELRSGGSRVETVFPDDPQFFGANAMDFSLRPAAARAGRDQGRALAAQLTEWWV
jgi:NTE family protein